MKINTDGVLLAALAVSDTANTILDIGTGTGVIALMLAQKFNDAHVDAVEIDAQAADTANINFESSPFSKRLKLYALSFEAYFKQHPEKQYDLIVSNPPFYIDSLKSPGAKKALAKHTDVDFFEQLIKNVSRHLTPNGSCCLILPVNIAEMVTTLAAAGGMYLQKTICVQSYAHSQAHRAIICIGFNNVAADATELIIYKAAGIYTDEYQKLLQPYFLNF